ncbi:MAG: cell division protein FtsH, partial [Lachnospiraceae bacterium]
ILRPGRFDRKVGVGKPDVRGREEILRVHVKKKPLAEDVDLEKVAQTTAGFSGADLENLMNEAAIRAARMKRPFINQEDIEAAFIKVGIGAEKKSRVISDKEKRITAYHEAGHAILFHVLPDMDPVHTISIIPTGMGAAGYTMPLPGKDNMFSTKGKMLQHIIVSMGGRAAEELIFGDVTTGASQDIQQATDMAKAMVMDYGMSKKLGMIHYDEENCSQTSATAIDDEVKSIIDTCYAKAMKILTEHEQVLHKCAEALIQKEKLGREEFEEIFQSVQKLM